VAEEKERSDNVGPESILEPVDKICESYRLRAFGKSVGARQALRREFLSQYPQHAEKLACWFEVEDEGILGDMSIQTTITGYKGPDSLARGQDTTGKADGIWDRFKDAKQIGKGGQGEVYRAVDSSTGRHVAVKLIRKDVLLHEQFVERFQREMEVAIGISHPKDAPTPQHVIITNEVGILGQTLFIAMEYIEGSDLNKLVKQRLDRDEGPLPIDLASDYALQAAKGLVEIHGRGVTHRDIKPSNLLLSSEEPIVKILDLGLALLRNAKVPTITDDADLLGTADYMPPEQAKNPHHADPRADIYSLGCTLYYLLTGRPPFPEGTVAKKLIWHCLTEPEPVASSRHDIPADLAGVVHKMMEKDPDLRYQSADDVIMALAPHSRHVGVTASHKIGSSRDLMSCQAGPDHHPTAVRIVDDRNVPPIELQPKSPGKKPPGPAPVTQRPASEDRIRPMPAPSVSGLRLHSGELLSQRPKDCRGAANRGGSWSLRHLAYLLPLGMLLLIAFMAMGDGKRLLTVEIDQLSPNRRTTEIEEIGFSFSEAVEGFDLDNLQLIRKEDGYNLLTDQQALLTEDHIHWKLTNLSKMTGVSGNYVLSLGKITSIKTTDGKPLAKGARSSWAVDRPPDQGWAVRAGQGGQSPNDGGQAIAVDRSGNVYVVGSFYGEGDSGNSPAHADIFIAKYSPKGLRLWQHIIGGSKDDRAKDVALSRDGKFVYVIGRFEGQVDFNPDKRGIRTLESGRDSCSAFILKLHTNSGAFADAYAPNGGSSEGMSIAVDARGAVVATGTFHGQINFDNHMRSGRLESIGWNDVFILKLGGSGNHLWSKRVGGEGDYDVATAITTDDGENVLITGSFMKTVDFNPGSGASILTARETNKFSTDTFILKLDKSGNYVWAKQLAGDGGWQAGCDILSDNSGLYVTGVFQGTVDFDPGENSTELTAQQSDGFILKMGPSGDFAWVRHVSSPGDDRGHGLAKGPDGRVYAVGHFQGTALIGDTPGSDPRSLSSAGDEDGYLLILNPSGSLASSRQMGGVGKDEAKSVMVDGKGAAHVTGFFQDTSDMDTLEYIVTLDSSGGKDLFILKQTCERDE
jgi:serine/threonine protein kinase